MPNFTAEDFEIDNGITTGLTDSGEEKLINSGFVIDTFPSEVVTIREFAFTGINIIAIKDWGNVTTIENLAFYNNQITALPDSWGSVTSIGSSAFYNNQITALPDSWGSVTSIGHYAFYNNKITALPDSWGNITTIGSSAFYNNKITALPDSWGNITRISNGAFRNNQITALPNDWGDVTIIGRDAFRSNQITALPDSWGNVTTIGSSAFYNNKITALPDSWGNITSIGYNAFYRNRIRTDDGKIIFTMPDKNLTRDFIKGLESSRIPGTIIVYTDNGTNPNGAQSSAKFLINPKTITVKHQDKDGKTLASDTTKIITDSTTGSHELSAPAIYGYRKPRNATVDISGTKRDFEHIFVYEKYTDKEIESLQKANITLSTGGTEKRKTYTADGSTDAVVTVGFDRSGFRTGDITNPTIRVDVSGDVLGDSIRAAQAGDQKIVTNIESHGDYFTFTYNGTIRPGDTVEIPFFVKFRQYETPSNTPFIFQATMMDSTTGEPLAQSNEDYLKATYKKPYMHVNANNSNYQGHIGNYDRTIADDNTSHVADKGNNGINYNISINNLDRNSGKYVITVPLPTYSIHENSSVTPTLPGNQGYAVFNKEDNPGWELDEKNHTVTYTGDAKGEHKIPSVPLTLRYPGGKESENIVLSPHGSITPFAKADDEPLMTVSDSVSNYFYRWVPPKGHIFIKQVSYPQQEYGRVFYDNTKSRSEDFGWNLVFNAHNTDLNNVVIGDTKLDDRMFFDHAVIPSSFGNGRVVAYDKDGATLWQQDFVANKNGETVRIPRNIGLDTDKLEFIASSPIKKGNYGSIRLVTKIREPHKSHYNPTHGEGGNTFSNTMEFSSKETGKASSTNSKVIRAADQKFMATKRSSFGGSGAITGSNGVYTIGMMPAKGYGEDIHNYEQVDLLPKGIEVTGYTMNPNFAKNPGAKVEFVENYRGTGHDAVVWTADTIPYDNVQVGVENIVGTVSVHVGLEVPSGSMVNDVFARADEVDEMNAVADDRLPAGQWSKAQVSNSVEALKIMMQRKSIRTYDDQGKPTLWRTHADTYPGQKMDYRLRITNGTDKSRTGVEFYDVLPIVGDHGIGDTNGKLPRESEFANVFDTSRKITVPEGMVAQYYNSDKPVPEYDKSNVDSVLKNLNWSNTPAANTKAIRVISKPGTKMTLKERSSIEVIVPMVANKDTKDGISGIPSDETNGKTAWNSFFQKDDDQTRLLEGNRVSNTMVGKPLSVEFTKKGMGDKGLSGAQFEYRRADGTFVAGTTSDDNGKVRFTNIKPEDGDYIIESKAPNGYVKSDDKRIITADTLRDHYKSGRDVLTMDVWKNYTPMVPIEPMVGSLEFTKVDADGKPLQGVKFELTKKWSFNGKSYSFSREMTSNAEGKVVAHNIPAGGGYTLTEVSAPGHLSPIKPINNIQIKRDQTTKPGKTIGNNKNAIANDKVDIPLVKIGVNESRLTDEDGNTRAFGSFGAIDGAQIEGAEIRVVRVDNNTQVATATIGRDTIRGLEVGVLYRIEETKVPEKYRKPAFPMEFSVNNRGAILGKDGKPFVAQTALFIPNVKEDEVSTASITKTDDNGTVLPGAEFVLEKNTNDTWKPVANATRKTNQDGVAHWENIAHGKYRIREAKAPKGYATTDQVFEFTATATKENNFTYRFTNHKITPLVSKVEMIVENVDLETAHYTKSKLANQTNVKVVDSDRGYNVIRTLEGAELELKTDPEGAAIETLVTDSNGEARVTSPIDENTTYYLVETKAPAGYTKRVTPVTFTASHHTKIDGFRGEFTVYVPNAKESGTLVISKVDQDTSAPVLGSSATFRVESTDKNNPWTRDIKTNPDNGIAILGDIPFGNYTLTEVEAPQGYTMDLGTREFTIGSEKANVSYVITNKADTPRISLIKKINGHDANNKLSAVLLDRDDEKMTVTFDVTNTGNTLLRDVTVTDVVEQGGDTNKINSILAGAQAVVTDNDNERLETTNGTFTNGKFNLAPGGKATITIEVDTPEKNVLHTDNATVVGYHGNIEVSDDDPANAVKFDTAVPLPETGAQGLAIMAMIIIILTGGAAVAYRRKA